MSILTLIIIANAIVAIALQAIFPNKRHVIMFVSASLALILSTLTTTLNSLLGSLPWDTVLILFALTVYGEFIFGSKLFDYLIKKIAVLCKGKLHLIILSPL